jgi:hypothetical protein
MVKPTNGLLTIQEFIFLLDDFHYNEFISYLSSVKASLPLKLSETIRQSLPEFDKADDLCIKIYGSNSKTDKQNFNQLSSYTFRLSHYLAQNYPAYLHHNVSLLEQWINEGHLEEANFLARSLMAISERNEDWAIQTFVLKFTSQQGILIKDISTGMKADAQLERVLELESLFVSIQSALRNALHNTNLANNPEEQKRLNNYFLQFENHESPSISILSRFAYINMIYTYDLEVFRQPEFGERIKKLEKDLDHYSYIVFPFMSDFKGNFDFIKLNSPYTYLNTKEGKKDFEALGKHYESLKYLDSYLNAGQLHLIAIEATRILSLYHCHLHRPDYFDLIAEKDLKSATELAKKCNDLLEKNYSFQQYEYAVRSLKMLYGALLMLCGGDNIKKGIDELESLLVTYQQFNFKGATDSIYMCLMIGYFSVKDYEKCAHTFKRYIKIVKDKPIFESNDIKIHAYYYLSQWLIKKSPQYTLKMQALLQSSPDKAAPVTLVELVKYFQMPVDKSVIAINQ